VTECRCSPLPLFALLSQAELADDRAVTLDVVLLQVVQQISSVTDHLLQTAAAVEVLLVGLEVLGQVRDAAGQNCNLYLGRTGVSFVGSVLLDQAEFFFLLHGFFTFLCFICVSLSSRWVKKLLDSLVSENRAHAYNDIIPHIFHFVNRFLKKIYYKYYFYNVSGKKIIYRTPECVSKGREKGNVGITLLAFPF